MNRLNFACMLSVVLWFSQTKAQQIIPVNETALQSYIDTALKRNPVLQAWQYQNDALQQKIKPAKSLDDPMLYGGIMNLPTNFSFRQDMMTMTQIGIQQNFSVRRKYALKGEVAKKEFETGTYDVQAQKLSLIRQVKQQYYELYSQTKAIETILNSLDALTNYIGIANTRYSTGLGVQQDIYKAQLELTKMQDELVKMQSMRKYSVAAFNTSLNRSLNDSILVPAEIKFSKIDLEIEAMMMEAEKNNPVLLASKSVVSKDSLAHQLAKTSTIPDLNTGFWYGQRQAVMPDGSKARDMMGIMIAVNLPLWYKQKQSPLIAESNINIQMAQSEVEATQNEIKLLIHHAIVDADKNEKLVALYSSRLIPQAEQNLHAGIIGYQENKIDFLTLIDNFLSLYNYRLQYHQAIADYFKAIAEIEMLTGKNLIIR